MDKKSSFANVEELFDQLLWQQMAEVKGRKPRIAVTGISGTGKSLLVRRLLGMDVSPSARLGKGKYPSFFQCPLFDIVDASGVTESDFNHRLGCFDISDNFSHKIIESSDIVIYLTDCEDPTTFHEGPYREYHSYFKYNAPLIEEILCNHPATILVVNKIDILPSKSSKVREVVETNIAFISSLLKPCKEIRISAFEDHSLIELVDLMEEILPQSDDSFFRSSWADYVYTGRREEQSVEVVKRYAMSAGVIGTIPIPFSDIVPLTALQITMFLQIAEIFGHHYSKEQAVSTLTSLAGSYGARAFNRTLTSIVKGIPVIGSFLGVIAGGATAYVSFEIFGRMVIDCFKDIQKVSPQEIQKFYETNYQTGKKEYKKSRGIVFRLRKGDSL